MSRQDFSPAIKNAAWDLIDRKCPLPGCQEQAKVLKGGRLERRGDVAHIIAASDSVTAPRSPSSLSGEDRRTFKRLIDNRDGLENALAVCANCHRKADRDTDSFSVRFLYEAQQEVVHRGAKPSGYTPRQRRGLASLSVDDFSEDPDRAQALWDLICANGTADLWQPYSDDPEALREVAASWKTQLAGEPWQTAEYLARCAWTLGLWKQAQALWTATAYMATQAEASLPSIAAAWVHAAAAARRQGADDDARDLVRRARELAPKEPVVVMAGVTSPMPVDALSVLEPLADASEPWRSWRHVHRALSFLLVHDLQQVQKELDAVDGKHIPASTLTGIQLNYEVERAHHALGEARPFDAQTLQRDVDGCFAILEDLLRRHRPSEAVRIRMLIARGLLQLDQQPEAVELLGRATAEETSTWEHRGVLAYAYIEAGEQARAIQRIGDAHLDQDAATRTDAIRLRVEAQTLYSVLPLENAQSLVGELSKLRNEPGWDDLTAAGALAAIAAASDIPWPPEADDLLRDQRNVLPVQRLRRSIEASRRTCPDWRIALGNMQADPAALRILLARLIARRARHSIKADVARSLLATDSHARARYMSAAALMDQTGTVAEGYAAMLAVGRDRNAPRALRAMSYYGVLRHLRRHQDHGELRRIYHAEILPLRDSTPRPPARVKDLVNEWMPSVSIADGRFG